MNDPDWMAKNRRASYNMMPRVENWTAAYKLSQEEARDIAVSYVLNNYLTLEKPVKTARRPTPRSANGRSSSSTISAAFASLRTARRPPAGR
jgi:hypothetical protein